MVDAHHADQWKSCRAAVSSSAMWKRKAESLVNSITGRLPPSAMDAPTAYGRPVPRWPKFWFQMTSRGLACE